MALTRLRANIIANGTVTNAKIEDSSIQNAKLAAPFTTGKAIAMSLVFG